MLFTIPLISRVSRHRHSVGEVHSELAPHAGALEVAMLQDAVKTKEQITAEAKVEGFRDKLGPFVVAAETTRMPMVFTDAKAAGNPIIFVNQSFLALTGYDEDEGRGSESAISR